MTDTKEHTTYDEAVQTRDRWERVIKLILLIEDRESWNAPQTSWDGLRERIIEEHISEPLDITVNASMPLYIAQGYESGNVMDYVTDIDVLYGTGGPATGVRFKDRTDADVWFQNWFTPKEYAPLDPDCAAWLSDHLGLEW